MISIRASLVLLGVVLAGGDQDMVVPIAQDQRLDAVLQASGVAHEFHVYPGVDHTDVATRPTVLARIRTCIRRTRCRSRLVVWQA